MRRLFLLAAIVLLFGILPMTVNGQGTDKYRDYYRSPMNIPLILSANFAETRTNHFHSGIDIKTGGKEGEPLYSVADGYIARVGVIPSGFGRVLYIAHPNGTTTVYAHIQWFTKDIESYVATERHRLKQHRVDLYPAADKFQVKKGQLIGYSGNSGTSFGPHLHFELRNTASQRTLNTIKRGIYNITDTIFPMIMGFYYVETDTVNNIPTHSLPREVKIKKVSEGQYTLSDTTALEIGPKGYFVLEATDRKNNTHNTMGVYSVTARLDGQTYFSFKLDDFSFADTRYVNSLSHYALQKGSRNELIRLAIEAGNKLPIYSDVNNRGLVMLDDFDEHTITIAADDDSGNTSTLSFAVKRRADSAPFVSIDSTGIPIDRRKFYTRSGSGLDLSIPAGALYESIFYTQNMDSVLVFTGGKMPNVPCYSMVYSIHNDGIPIHTNISVAITPSQDVPADIHSRLSLARIDDKGWLTNAGGAYENGKVVGKVRTFGRYCVVADVVPPSITASFADKANLVGAKSISFTVKDNFSGVASFYATIDGQWIPFEQKSNVITHWFDPSRIAYKGTAHNLELRVVDGKGNRTVIKRSFVR